MSQAHSEAAKSKSYQNNDFKLTSIGLIPVTGFMRRVCKQEKDQAASALHWQ